MDEKTGGKRLAPDENKKKKTVLVIAAGVVLALCAAYVGLCAYAARDVMWPGTQSLGVDVSGLSTAQAAEKVRAETQARWTGRTVELVEPQSGKRFTLDAGGLMEPGETLERDLTWARHGGGSSPFLTLGPRYVGRLISKTPLDVGVALRYTNEGAARMDALVEQISKDLGVGGNETVYHITDDAVVFTKGRTATTVDAEALRRDVTFSLSGTGSEEVEIALIQASPAEPDFEAIRDKIFTAAKAAYLDPESHEIVPSVTGRDFDVDDARYQLELAEEGENCRVELTLDVPSPTTEELGETLFRDVLAEAVTKVTGSSVRVKNVGVTADFVNGCIVMPGEEFSYAKVCTPFTVENGYGKAPAYVNGLSKDVTAGGACQCSSTLYWATLKANLETVERYAHGYEPSYIAGGLDATVYGDYGEEGSLDFRFRNTSEYPIKLEAYVDAKNYLHVLIHGTDTTGIHGEPYSTNRVVTRAYKTVYQADSSVPQGTTRKDPERTGYNGVSIETYQKLVDKDGEVIEEKLLYKTKYAYRDAVVYFHPDDLALWGIDPYTGLRAEPTADPTESAAPAESADPTESADPAVTEVPGEETPPAAETPAVQTPGETGSPAAAESPTAESTPPGSLTMPSPVPTLEPPPESLVDPDAPLLPPGL